MKKMLFSTILFLTTSMAIASEESSRSLMISQHVKYLGSLTFSEDHMNSFRNLRKDFPFQTLKLMLLNPAEHTPKTTDGYDLEIVEFCNINDEIQLKASLFFPKIASQCMQIGCCFNDKQEISEFIDALRLSQRSVVHFALQGSLANEPKATICFSIGRDNLNTGFFSSKASESQSLANQSFVSRHKGFFGAMGFGLALVFILIYQTKIRSIV